MRTAPRATPDGAQRNPGSRYNETAPNFASLQKDGLLCRFPPSLAVAMTGSKSSYSFSDRQPPACGESSTPWLIALSLASLEYWVARSSRTTTTGVVSRVFVFTGHSFAISRPDMPEVCHKFLTLQSEGAGNAGRPMRPIAACARIVVERTRVSQVTPESPSIPRAMVLRLISCSPRRPGFLATVACGYLRKLDTSVGVSGPHNFTVRKKRPRL